MARAYFVPETTLRDRIKGRVEVDATVGQKLILTDEEEAKLETYLISCCEIGVGKTRQQVKEMAFALVSRAPQGRNQAVVQKWMEKQKTGDDWYYRFMSRHPNLSLRKPEKLAHSRAIMANKTVVDDYYTKLKSTIEENDLTSCPELILNADETGVPLDFRPSRVVSPKNTKNVWSVSSGDKTNITVMGCGNAAGEMIKPLVIFKGKRTNEALQATAPPTNSNSNSKCLFDRTS